MTHKENPSIFSLIQVFRNGMLVPTLVNRASPLAAGTPIDMTLIVNGSISQM